MKKFKTDWICTDPDAEQYGRQLSPTLFQFYEGENEPLTIDLGAYTNGQIEEILNSYGYSLFRSQDKDVNIYKLYSDKIGPQSAIWVIAECVFESEKASLRKINE